MDIQKLEGAGRSRFIVWGLGAVSLIYYYLLCSKQLTWIYTSGDAGDWLILTNWWYVPHVFGDPLMILYIRFLSLFPGDDVIKLTVGLAVIPGSVCVMLVYMIAREMTGSIRMAVISVLVLLGATVFLTQATVLEQYALVAMFLIGAFYFHIRGKKLMVMLFLGLTTATHIVGLPITFLWIMCYWREWREWLRVIPIYATVGLLPYGLVLYLMADPSTPKLLAGGLSWGALNSYLGNPTSAGLLAVADAHNRLLQFGQVVLISMGLALVPFFRGISMVGVRRRVAIVVIAFLCWFYVTNLFPSVWKWLTICLPMAAVYVAVGLQGMARWHRYVVVGGAVALIIANGFLMNSDVLAREKPQATEYLEEVRKLPENAAVITPRGGAYGFALFYAMSEGQRIVPLAKTNPFAGISEENDQSYVDYLAWLERSYGVKGRNMYEIVQYCLDHGYNVYHGEPISELWSRVFTVEPNEKGYMMRVTAVDRSPDFSPWVTEEGNGK